ncbi:UNVERIFIED_CONTAM: hypothetical protein Slati_4571900 [Sesamum latifolium]|uniref:Uncharacterized protein n=1 Tax=Sesamum latifolium TaxID=2727402 RepID=A0AAW2SFW3_9LAMI
MKERVLLTKAEDFPAERAVTYKEYFGLTHFSSWTDAYEEKRLWQEFQKKDRAMDWTREGGYDLEAAFSCQPNEDGMNSWSWCFSVRK